MIGDAGKHGQCTQRSGLHGHHHALAHCTARAMAPVPKQSIEHRAHMQSFEHRACCTALHLPARAHTRYTYTHSSCFLCALSRMCTTNHAACRAVPAHTSALAAVVRPLLVPLYTSLLEVNGLVGCGAAGRRSPGPGVVFGVSVRSNKGVCGPGSMVQSRCQSSVPYISLLVFSVLLRSSWLGLCVTVAAAAEQVALALRYMHSRRLVHCGACTGGRAFAAHVCGHPASPACMRVSWNLYLGVCPYPSQARC